MHIARQSGRHAILGRALLNEEDIEARDPSLINLPIPLPSIPVLSPILSPLVGGNNQPSSSKTPSATPTSAPAASTPTPSSAPSGGSGGGTSTGSGSSTGSGGAPSSGSSSSGGSGDSGSSGSSSPSGSSGSSTGDTGSSGSAGSGDTGSSGGTPAQPSSVVVSGSSSASATSSGSASSPSDTASTGNTGSGSDLSSSANLGGDGTSSSSGGNTGGIPGTANAGGLPGNGSAGSSSNGSSSGSPSIGANGLPISTQANGSGNTSGSGTTPGNNATAGSSKPHTSTGVIVAIVLVLLLFLAVLALGLRRRQRARRNDRANKWWFTKKRTSQTYGDADGNRNSTEILPVGARSARSSFATTVDHSNTPRNGSFIIPPLPPMAEVGRTNGTAPTLVIDVPQFGDNQARFSIGSQGSSDSQFLVVNHRDSMAAEMVGTPMSVRPFSPSESFAFPKPPDPAGDRTSAYSRPSSTATLGNSNKSPTISPYTSYGEIIPPIPSAPAFPPPALGSPNPFVAPPLANPFADNNPFDDTQSTPTPDPIPFPAPISGPSVTAGAFADVEYIKRPFNPSLTDELKVSPDDGVRVLQTFDDGWALVEKVSSADGKDEANHGNLGKGLIPIDCLREPGQSLPSFFAVKRVSNYAESTHTVSSESPFAFSAF